MAGSVIQLSQVRAMNIVYIDFAPTDEWFN